ncbi:MAG: hypothetical protein IIX15_03170 [Clostridia bacterium]|nr:hypothetical protein [Clostridia bacterium]
MRNYVDVNSMITRAAVCYDGIGLARSTEHPPFLMGNGLFGGCVDGLGMFDSLTARPTSFLWHKYHVEVGRDQLECRLPLLLLRYAFNRDGQDLPLTERSLRDYNQTLDVQHGTVTTAFTLLDGETPAAQVTLRQMISLADTGLMQCEFAVCPTVSGLTLTVENELLDECISHHGVHIAYPCQKTVLDGTLALYSTTTRGAATLALVSPDAKAIYENDRVLSLTFDCATEATYTVQTVLVSSRENMTPEYAVRAVRTSTPDQLRAAHEAAWREFWSVSIVDMGDETLNLMRLRFMYAMRSCEGGDVPLSPGGLGSTGLWPFEFPQDVAWMFEAYMGTGHLDVVKGTAHYWVKILDQVKEFTRKYFRKENGERVGGAFYPWMCPQYDLSPMPAPPTDPPYANQLHNGAYPLFICYLYWKYTGDQDYLRSVLPVARAAADFYVGISTYEAEHDSYAIRYKPCMGQDELGSFNRDNYICCVSSAAWTIDSAIEMLRAAGEQPDPRWLHIQQKGYCFDRLTVDDLLTSYEGGITPNPQQKHPAQLNLITLRPAPAAYATTAFAATHARRYEFCRDAEKNFWMGWSLCSFLVSSVRMKDVAACRKDFGMLRTNCDADQPMLDRHGLQMLETSGCSLGESYYITSMCMVVTAMTELFLQSFDGNVCDIFPVTLTAAPVAFDNLMSSFGFAASGHWEDGRAEVTLSVTRQTEVTLRLGRCCRGNYALLDADGREIGRFEGGKLFAEMAEGEYRIISV